MHVWKTVWFVPYRILHHWIMEVQCTSTAPTVYRTTQYSDTLSSVVHTNYFRQFHTEFMRVMFLKFMPVSTVGNKRHAMVNHMYYTSYHTPRSSSSPTYRTYIKCCVNSKAIAMDRMFSIWMLNYVIDSGDRAGSYSQIEQRYVGKYLLKMGNVFVSWRVIGWLMLYIKIWIWEFHD